MKREECHGYEYDWWAVDHDGHVATFSTAGFGEVPAVALEAPDAADWDRVEETLIADLPPVGTWSAEGRGPGTCEDWKRLAERGIFVFDWKHYQGPYERILLPSRPTRAETLLPWLLERVQRVRLPALCFAETRRIDADQLRLLATP